MHIKFIIMKKIIMDLVGGLKPSEKYESQLGLLFTKYGKNVPNHQPVYKCINHISFIIH